MELWNQVHSKTNPKLFHPKSAKQNSEYIVELYCRGCGHRLYGNMYQPRKKLKTGEKRIYAKRLVYTCHGRKQKVACSLPQQRAEKVHEFVLGELRKTVTSKRVIKELTKKRQDFLDNNLDSFADEIKAKEKLLKQKQTFLQKIEQDYASGDLSARLYSKHVEETTDEIASIKESIARLSDLKRRSEIKIEPVEEILSWAAETLNSWDLVSNKTKKAVISAFFPRIEIDKNGDYFITRQIPISLGF